jgi:serine/threonine protein kinase
MKLLHINTNCKSPIPQSSGDHGMQQVLAMEYINHVTLGAGAFFDVFKVTHRTTGKEYAVKRSKRVFRSKRDRGEYLREVQLVSQLNVHPNIITYHRAWQEEMHFWIQMECCDTNLSEFIASRRSKKKLPESFFWDCFHQIAQGLEHVHNGNLIHLDIKPENVLVNINKKFMHKSKPVYKLGDFGQARLKGQWQDGSEGDAQYMAPELFSGDKDPQASADIFSLGLLMFELCTNVALPKSGSMWHELRSGDTDALKVALATVPRSLAHLITLCLNPEPTKRPNASDIVTQFQKRNDKE